MTTTVTAFERIESACVALTCVVPACAKVTDTCPLASLVAPLTSAPATGLPVDPSVTVKTTGIPRRAVVGPVSFKKWSLLKASNANRISSLTLTSCWQPPTGMNSKLRSIPQNSVAVWVSPPMEVMKKSSNAVENVLYQRFMPRISHPPRCKKMRKLADIPIKRETIHLGCVGQCTGTSGSRGRICIVVLPITFMSSTGGCSDIVAVSKNGSFENGVRWTFNS